ncbi:MAG TPA: DUF692 domain-containing protein [Alphaproteobacteria bacterium]|nr:DUF692 domain-containing protein [Alphaproteobacteria bacterium]
MVERTGEAGSIPTAVGIGLRGPHVVEILATRPAIGWFEVHPENYMGGGPALARLDAIRRDYPISFHGVGLSLGSAKGIDAEHLQRLRRLIRRTEPFLISEHLSWSVVDGSYLNDLLPLPYTEEALDVVTSNVRHVQYVLGRPVLVENPSAYLRFRHSTISEPEFLAELVRRTCCRLLCDVNNIHVSCANFGLDAAAYLDALPADSVAEVHLAGHFVDRRHDRPLLIDDHGSPVAPAVWDLYRRAVARFGAVPSLVEWDKQIPELSVLLDEAQKAERIAQAMGAIDAPVA